MPHHILVACMPKSASTFTSNALSAAAGLQKIELVPGYGRREQELCEIRLAECAGLDYVAQQHTKHSNWTEQVCNEYRVSMVVLVRSLLDIVVSLRDHVHRESPVNAMFHLDKKHVCCDDTQMERMIATLAIPWYINFYMGWRESKSARIFMYEDIIADPERAVGEMLDFSGIAVPKEQIAAGVDAAVGKGSRINVAKAGRGSCLQPATVSMIMEMLSLYPEIQGDAYVQMMKAQAEDILANRSGQLEAAANVGQAVRARSVSRQPLHQRVTRFCRRKARLFGGTRNQLIAGGLLMLAVLYFAFLHDLIPDTAPGGRIDDFVVPAICAFLAGRLLTRIKIRRVPVVNGR